MNLVSLVETLDAHLDKVERLIRKSIADDPELATQRDSLNGVQDGVDKTAAAAIELDTHLRDLARRG
ncbi:hypothetical protein GCM10029964_128850 [Kibdelosporangium lantanae]